MDFLYATHTSKMRYVYAISYEAPKNVDFCLMHNGQFFYKRPRSDEKLTYNEETIYTIVRTVLFMILFRADTWEDVYETLYTGDVTWKKNQFVNIDTNATLSDIVHELDDFFGLQFSRIAQRSVTRVYYEYMKTWRYYRYGLKISTPSAHDIVSVYRFINNRTCSVNRILAFVRSEVNYDNKIYLQNRVKVLKS